MRCTPNRTELAECLLAIRGIESRSLDQVVSTNQLQTAANQVVQIAVRIVLAPDLQALLLFHAVLREQH